MSVSQSDKKTFLSLLLSGLIIGVASITPGLSGGILAIALGLYAPALDAVTKLRKDFKNSFLFLMPLAIGAVIGILVFGIIMKPLLENYETSIIYLFWGLVLGSIPSVLKKASDGGFRILYFIPFLITFAIGMILAGAVDSSIKNAELSPVILLISGGVLSLGMVVPGISSSFLLLQMGVYDKIIDAFLSVNVHFILWIVLGFAIVSLTFVKLINMAFKKFHGYAYFAALGFLLSSMIAVFPGLRAGWYLVTDIILVIVGAAAVYCFMKKTE